MVAPAGRKVGRFHIIRKLGEGGMSNVYPAHDPEAGFEIALKLIKHVAGADARDSTAAERQGAKLQQQIAERDERVAKVYEIGDADGYFYIAMGYVDGHDLAEEFRGTPVTPVRAVENATEVLRALEVAHRTEVQIEGGAFRGIVHGDIKPKNIRIDSRERVRILGFGIAKALSPTRRVARSEFSSLAYTSPEPLKNGEVDVQSDLWAVAVMLSELLTRKRPYVAACCNRGARALAPHLIDYLV